MKKDTRIHLVEELRKLPQSDAVSKMIEEALAGEYHDFKNNKYDCGKVAVVGLLEKAGFSDLANRVKMGEFDESPDAEDILEMRKDWPEHMWEAFGLGDEKLRKLQSQ